MGSGVGEGDQRAGNAAGLSEIGAGVMEAEKRFSSGVAADFQSEPRQGLANACAERFGSGLFSSEASGEVSGRTRLGAGVGDFVGKENTFKKPIAEAAEGVFDAVDFD